MSASFVLIPGAGGSAWYWHRVTPLLEAAGHRVSAVDLPGDDERAGLDAYAELVLRAIGQRDDVVLVAQSLGGFTAPLVCERARVRALVLVNPMIPTPGETAGAWWANTESEAARLDAAKRHGYNPQFDLATYMLHDVPPEVVQAGEAHQRPEVKAAFAQPCKFQRWPDAPTYVVVGKEDRFFPRELQLRLAAERLPQAVVDEVTGGHLVALSNPQALADLLLSYERGAS